MEAVAKLRNCPTSPRKMRYTIDTIRGKDIEKALAILKYSSKEAAKNVEKLLLSAIANWQQVNEGKRIEDSQLFVKTAFVDQGKTLKRWLPAPQGRAYRLRKRSNHVTLIVASKLEVGKKEEVQQEAAQSQPPVGEGSAAEVKKAKAPKAAAKKTTSKKTTKKS